MYKHHVEPATYLKDICHRGYGESQTHQRQGEGPIQRPERPCHCLSSQGKTQGWSFSDLTCQTCLLLSLLLLLAMEFSSSAAVSDLRLKVFPRVLETVMHYSSSFFVDGGCQGFQYTMPNTYLTMAVS